MFRPAQRRIAVALLALGPLVAGACTTFNARPTNETQLLSLFAFLGAMISIPGLVAYGASLKVWPTGGSFLLGVIVPLLVSGALALSAGPLGQRLRDRNFRAVRLPGYAEVVRHIETQDVPRSPSLRRFVLAAEQRDLARFVDAWRAADGSLTALFVYGGFFPVKHTAYIYTGSGAWDEALTGQWRGRRIDAHWFDASD